MALCSRLYLNQFSRKLAAGNCHNKLPWNIFAVRSVAMKPVADSCPAAAKTSHDERNMKLGRPQSPHLTIYAPQLTTMLSISHRMTGMMLSGYVTLFSVSTLFMNEEFLHYSNALETMNINSGCLFMLKYLIAFPFSFHFCNGLRHLAWDFGMFLTIKEVYTTGYIVLAASVVSTAVLASL